METVEPSVRASRGAPSLLARLIPLAILMLLATVAVYWGLPDQLGLEKVQARREALLAFREAHPLLMVAVFLLAYTLIAAAVPPGGFLMMLVSGFLFGFWLGGALSLAGCTLGAVLTYQAGRTALGRSLEGRVKGIEEQLTANAFFATLFLHIFPLVPYFLVNLAAGLAGVPMRKFVPATILGVAPAAIAWVAIGDGAGAALDAGDGIDTSLLAHPQIFLPLAVLSVLSGGVFVYRLLARR